MTLTCTTVAIGNHGMTLTCATVLLAFFTAASVIFTACMAWFTRDLAKKNDELIQQNEKHHMDSYRPILIIETPANVELYNQRPIVSVIKDPHLNNSPISNNLAKYHLDGNIKNIGTGPALDISLLIRFEHSTTKELVADFPPLKNDALQSLGDVSFYTPSMDSDFLQSDNKFKPEEYHSAPGESWIIYITYKDIYDNKFYTIHPKSPQERWTTLGRGDIPQGKSSEEVAKGHERIRLSTKMHSEQFL
jgi:hypothetical protein